MQACAMHSARLAQQTKQLRLSASTSQPSELSAIESNNTHAYYHSN